MENPKHEDGALLKVAQAISDGRPVDWESESRAQADSAPELSHLKAMAALAEAHRKTRPTHKETFDDTVPLHRPAAARAAPFLRPALWGAGVLVLLYALRRLLLR